MNALIYFLVAIISTTLGSITGMGGGVIIKPLLDMIKDYDIVTINSLSSLTVLSMALVSVFKHVKNKSRLDFSIALPLSIGSVLGGIIGEIFIKQIMSFFKNVNFVFIVQNLILAILILIIFIYMKFKNKIKTLSLKGLIPSFLVGLFLGSISSFLGIGGGPINIALIAFVFSYSTKESGIMSLVIILFAQIAKVSSSVLVGSFVGVDFKMLPPMIIGAILGGIIGSNIQISLSEKKIIILFNIVQIFVFFICIINIFRYFLEITKL